MHFDPAFVIKVFAALFAIMNPFANVPVFLSLTEGASGEAQKGVAVTASIGTAVGCLVAVVAGRAILEVFGISVEDFRLAGGLLLLLIALTMVQGEASHAHAQTPREQEDSQEAKSQQRAVSEVDFDASVAIYPLTVPLLVGPGTIATLIVFGNSARQDHLIPELAVGLVAFLALLSGTLLAAPAIGRHLSQTATAITRRVMGMILAAIAMEMIVSSLRVLFPGLAGGH
jgi:multiple antibiotic resistance protein